MLEAVFANKPGQTPQDVERRRRMAAQLLAQSQDSEPIRSPWQGVAKVAQALMGGYEAKSAENDDKNNRAAANKSIADVLLGSSPTVGDNRYTVADTGGGASSPSSGPRGSSTNVSDPNIFNTFMATVKEGGVTNPYGLAAIAATGKHESGFSPKNVYGNWADPSESGRQLTAGGAMSWNGPRYEAMKQFVAANGGDPNRPDPRLQAQYFLKEDPQLIAALNQAKSPEEAQTLMNNAWRFAGYNRPGGEAARRISTARGFAPQFAGGEQQATPTQVASLDPSAGFGDHGPVTQLSPEERQRRLAANQAGMANFTDAGAPRVSPDMAALQPPTQPGSVIQVPPREDVAGPALQQPQPAPMDWTDVPQLSVAAGVPFDNSQVPGNMGEALPPQGGRGGIMAQPMPQGAPQPQASPNQAISDELLRKNDLALGGIMAPQGTPQPQGAALGGAFPSAPSADRAPVASQGYFPPAPSAQSDRRAMIAQLLGNPYTAEAGQQLLMQEYKRQQEASDPANQLEIEYKRAQLDALKNKPAEKPTSDIQEYEYAKQQGFTGSFVDFQLAQKKAGASNVTVGGTSIEGEKKYDQTVGEGYGKDFTTMQTEAGAARKAITSLGAMEKEMDNPNFYSGAGGTTRENLKRLAASMGLDTEAASSMEAFGALSKKAVLDAMGGSLGTGVSNADRDYIEGQVPTIDTSPAGNKKIIGIQRKINQRKIEVAQRARDYARTHNGRIDAGFYDELDQWSEEHPLFEKEEAPTSAPATSGNDGWFDVPGGGRIKGSF